ncbi:hypothetical protein N7475_006751 [Penicillium sp. IBT 31633x]|nr:hypothetical protein N7475_006751 [Penicillium sp. IBT 31633x]
MALSRARRDPNAKGFKTALRRAFQTCLDFFHGDLMTGIVLGPLLRGSLEVPGRGLRERVMFCPVGFDDARPR